jgi:hypothetical protein
MFFLFFLSYIAGKTQPFPVAGEIDCRTAGLRAKDTFRWGLVFLDY